jgi:CxxC-x17-CxxC domain-containing protein
MAEFKKARFKSERRPFTKGGGRDFPQKEMYDAECNSCHQRCQVPFRPNGKKPVYCKDCYVQDTQNTRTRFDSRSDRPTTVPSAQSDSRFDDLKRELATVNKNLERLIGIIEETNRAAALTKEVRRLVPAARPASAPKRTPVPKKPAKRTTKKSK